MLLMLKNDRGTNLIAPLSVSVGYSRYEYV
jgi:hypothetical protein